MATQVTTRRGGFVDLEILLRPPLDDDAAPSLLVWVEVKQRAGLHGAQLDTYLGDIRERILPADVAFAKAKRAVVLLTPRGWEPGETALPIGVVRADWQSIARVAKRLRKEERRTAHVDHEAWLISEYNDYLKEEGLSDPDALTAASALALMEYNEASAAIAGACQHADAIVRQSWGNRTNFQKTPGKTPVPQFGRNYWAHHPDASVGAARNEPRWRGAWFEWGLRDTAQMQGVETPRGSWAFMAGLTLGSTNENTATAPGNEEWLSGRVAGGFQYFWISGYYRLARLCYPDELLRETTLERQGQALGAWIVDAFRELADNPPNA